LVFFNEDSEPVSEMDSERFRDGSKKINIFIDRHRIGTTIVYGPLRPQKWPGSPPGSPGFSSHQSVKPPSIVRLDPVI
jgi:hypothetical protein